MKLKSNIILVALLTAGSLACSAAVTQYAGSSATFTLDHHTQVPGDTLKPGEYTLRVLDQLSDRMIIRVDSNNSSEHVIFLGVPTKKLEHAASFGPVTWSSEISGQAVIRGFTLSTGAEIEFVYPKNQAVQLAKKNSASVVAIDPESQELPALKKMSKDDLTIVYLWTLSLTTVGNEKKPNAVLAQRFQTPEQLQVASSPKPGPVPSGSTQIARVEPPAYWSGSATPQQRRAPLKVLPKTSSPVTTVMLIGLLSAAFFGLVRISRRVRIEL